ncbi:lung adenoma susceptibility protein 2 isoform X2 [Triplophysa rosa]|nr:lung adenoma susceptibility protein 2 isoform X2 [Triplophysa rosa]
MRLFFTFDSLSFSVRGFHRISVIVLRVQCVIMWSDDVITSPESTVTSLLATSGHLQSGLHPEPVPTITYRDKRYVSASEALDAYIADFQKSPRDSETTTGKLQVTRQLPKPHPRNRDVLKTSLTEGELNFLNIPAQKRDSDGLSMTTDDLLALPTDGSLPVTRTSALLSQSGISPLGLSFNSSARSHSRPSGAQKRFMRRPHQRAPPTQRPSTSLPVDDLRSRHQGHSSNLPPHTPRSHYLPRWMTSQKSEMDFSGITSVPDLKYPGWLGQCEDSSSGSAQTPPPLGVPSWVGELEESRGVRRSDTEGHRGVKGHPRELCELRKMRLQFSEPVKRQEDERIDSLIFRAEQMLNSSSHGLCERVKGHNTSGDTEDSLGADRSWDNPPVTFKSPVPVGSADEPSQTEELQRNKSVGSRSSGYSSRRHPGPVEALKHMLLRLQAVEHNISQSNTTESPREPEEQLETEDHETSGESLQRALHHLERLKTLVEDMNERSHREPRS